MCWLRQHASWRRLALRAQRRWRGRCAPGACGEPDLRLALCARRTALRGATPPQPAVEQACTPAARRRRAAQSGSAPLPPSGSAPSTRRGRPRPRRRRPRPRPPPPGDEAIATTTRRAQGRSGHRERAPRRATPFSRVNLAGSTHSAVLVAATYHARVAELRQQSPSAAGVQMPGPPCSPRSTRKI